MVRAGFWLRGIPAVLRCVGFRVVPCKRAAFDACIVLAWDDGPRRQGVVFNRGSGRSGRAGRWQTSQHTFCGRKTKAAGALGAGSHHRPRGDAIWGQLPAKAALRAGYIQYVLLGRSSGGHSGTWPPQKYIRPCPVCKLASNMRLPCHMRQGHRKRGERGKVLPARAETGLRTGWQKTQKFS